MKHTYMIDWSAFTQEAKDNMVSAIKQKFVNQCEIAGTIAKQGEWHVPVPTSWVEAYVRSNAIDFMLWSEYERGDMSQKVDWQGIFDDYVIDHLHTKLGKIITNLPIEVEI